MQTNRNEYIDVVRGVGILLVVFGHLSLAAQPWRVWIYGFHMPLFFLLSGIFMRTDMPLRAFLRKRLRTLYLPFAVMLTFDKLVETADAVLRRGEGLFDAIRSTQPVLSAYAGVRFRTLNTPVWFLFVLFVIQIALWLLSKRKALLYAAAALSAASTLLLPRFALPGGLLYLNALPAFWFCAAGYIFRDPLRSFDPSVVFGKRSVWIWLPAAGAAPAYALCCLRNGEVDMIRHIYGRSPLLFCFCAAAGIVLALLGCCVLYRWMRLRKVLAWYGRNSLIVLVTHYYLTKFVYPNLLARFGLSMWRSEIWMECLLFALTMLLMIPTVLICRRWLYLPLGLPKPGRSAAPGT